jgi:hypothetical protein
MGGLNTGQADLFFRGGIVESTHWMVLHRPVELALIIGCTQSVRHGIDDVVDADANAKSGKTLGIGRAIGPFP